MKAKAKTKINKEQLIIADSNKTAAKIRAGQNEIIKKDSYFDGQEYRGYSIKTQMIRENLEEYNPVKLKGAKFVYQMFKGLEVLDQERFYSIVVDGDNYIIGVYLAFQGTLNSCLVHPREIFKTALLCSGAGIVLVHNHPSGKTEPSKEDFTITMRLEEAGEIIGIEILDHIIIGFNEYYSFQKRGLLNNFNKIGGLTKWTQDLKS